MISGGEYQTNSFLLKFSIDHQNKYEILTADDLAVQHLKKKFSLKKNIL